MRSFDQLVAEAVEADLTGWGFGWLDGRASEERHRGGTQSASRPGCHRSSPLSTSTAGVAKVLAEAPRFPARMVVTEAWPPNAQRARELFGPRGVQVIETLEGAPLPVPSESFELVSARHPVAPDWAEIHRVLVPGGSYFAQHVGPALASN